MKVLEVVVSPALLLLVFLVFLCTAHGGNNNNYNNNNNNNSPDLPHPSPNVILIEKGSIIIPMDDQQTNCYDEFNLKAYGFVVHLLYREIPVYWAIRAGKYHDDSDFSAMSSEVYPSCNGTAELTCYAGGPFIIPSAYSEAVLDFAFSWENGDHGVILHELEEDVDVDIRHFLYQKPKVLIASAEGPCHHIDVFELAGLVEGMHYDVLECPEDIEKIDCTSCYTLITVPRTGDDYDISAGYQSIESFVYSGGNFLAQDSAIESYENYEESSGDGGFLTAGGICPFPTGNERLLYPNADLPFGQFLGDFPGSQPGKVSDFCVSPYNMSDCDPNQKFWFKNDGFEQVINDPAAITCPEGQTAIIAAGGKLDDDDYLGGLFFYLGGFDWGEPCPDLDAGRRMILNTVLIPAVRPAECKLDFCPAEPCGCDSDCPPSQFCWEGLCVDYDGCCETDAECPSYQMCYQGECVNASYCCEVHIDCPSDQYCVQGVCIPPPAGSGLNCKSNSDCGPCQTCSSSSSCQATPNCCQTDGDCGPGCSCTNNTCACSKEGTTAGGQGSLGGASGGDGDGKTAAIVGGTVGGIVGLVALTGLVALAAVAGVLIFRFFKSGQQVADIASAFDFSGPGNSNVNPLHTPQESSIVNPLYSDI